MNDSLLSAVRTAYENYVQSFTTNGILPPMMALKRTHTEHVVENARLIAHGEGFDAHTVRICELAALLHDTGRYEQLKRYGTFRDSESVDHAVFSHDIVNEKKWLEECTPTDREAILQAILFHNRKDIPIGLDALTQAASNTVRDADKLDIFRVLEDQIATTDWRHDCAAFWNLPTTAQPNPCVLEAIRHNESVDYQHIRSLADFVLIQVGWMISGLTYRTTRTLCAQRGHAAFRQKFLHELTDDPRIDKLFTHLS